VFSAKVNLASGSVGGNQVHCSENWNSLVGVVEILLEGPGRCSYAGASAAENSTSTGLLSFGLQIFA